MLKIIGKKVFKFYAENIYAKNFNAENFCSSKPMLISELLPWTYSELAIIMQRLKYHYV